MSSTLIESWATAAAPPPDLAVSDWAHEHRRLPVSSAAQGAQWRRTTAPYLNGIMDVVNEPGVRKFALMKAHQTGGSEALHNVIAYLIQYDPSPILVVHPTVEVVQEWSKERLADMIRSTPALAAVVKDRRQPRRSHEGESTLQLKMFPGGFLALGGANTPNTFARRSVRAAFGDDVDRWPPVVGEEGDPAELLVNRTTTYEYNWLVGFVSTPTLKGGRIDSLYSRSDKRRFFLACPQCGREDFVTWREPNHFRVAYDERDPDTARLECPSPEHGGCGARIDEPMRRQMIAAAGERKDAWRPTATAKESGLVGFHLPAMISTLGVTLEGLVGKWLTARERGQEALRVFINTSLGEGWEDRTQRVDAHTLMSRRRDYGEEVEVPQPAVVLTAGIDVQVDRFELLVVGWGPAAERWVVDFRRIPGDPKLAETRTALLGALKRRYSHASGHLLPIHATCIDSGYATEEVYEFVQAYQARRIYATKGVAGRGGTPIVGKPSQQKYGRRPRPVLLYPVNVDDAKADVLSSLTLEAPGPGYMHFPILDTVDEEFFAQLTAEHRQTVYNKAGVATHSVWVQDRTRNEVLDCAVLTLAAFRLLNPNVRQMAEALAKEPVPSGTPPESPPSQSGEGGAEAPSRRRRVWDSPYLNT